jgi:hypothetical protein
MSVATGMARGFVVLDENIQDLKQQLQSKSLKVIVPVSGMDDDVIAEALAAGRILITNNTKDFKQLAIEFEFGIIGTEKATKDVITLAKQISSAITEHSLWSKKNPFLVSLKADGTSTYKDLSEPR